MHDHFHILQFVFPRHPDPLFSSSMFDVCFCWLVVLCWLISMLMIHACSLRCFPSLHIKKQVPMSTSIGIPLKVIRVRQYREHVPVNTFDMYLPFHGCFFLRAEHKSIYTPRWSDEAYRFDYTNLVSYTIWMTAWLLNSRISGHFCCKSWAKEEIEADPSDPTKYIVWQTTKN